MNSEPHFISAWANNALTFSSPNGESTVNVTDLTEFGMGSPTAGILTLSNGMIIPDCSPSIVWSNDSRFLAVPDYSRKYQRILVVDMSLIKIGHFEKQYRILQLHSFENNVIRGIDSPAWQPEEVEVDIKDVVWKVSVKC